MARHQHPVVSKCIDHQEGLVPFVNKHIDHQEGRWLVTNRRGSSLLSVSTVI